MTQVQQTAYLAVRDIGERLGSKDTDGFDTGEYTYLIRPRTFLIIGNLGQLTSQTGQVHQEKFRSFELYRRNLTEPEVITFDELFARAQWHVAAAEKAPEGR